jgi:hypothetical protein
MLIVSGPNWRRFFHADGIISLHSPGLENTRVNDSLGLFYWTENWLPVDFYWFLGVAVAFAFTIGLFTRISTLCLWLLIRSMLARNPYLANGEEMVMQMCLMYLILGNLGGAFSVDAWLRSRRGLPEITEISAWPIRMMQINVALVYLISLPYKMLQDPGWVTGDALHWTIASDMWGPNQYPWLTLVWDGWLRKALTFGTVFIEAYFPLAVWFRKTRLFAIIGISSLHLGIALLIPNVTYFTLAMVCCFVAFLTEKDFEMISLVRLSNLRRFFNWSKGSAIGSTIPIKQKKKVQFF